MADNAHKYGFRWVGSLNGGCCPKPIEMIVPTAYQAQVSATNVNLNAGDPVQFSTTTGFIELFANGSPSVGLGVIVGFTNVKVGLPLKGRKNSFLPGGTTWTTEENTSKALVIPFGSNIWEVDCDDKTTATTLAAYRALVNENADLSYTLDVSNPDNPRANPMFDISDHKTSTASFRLLNVSKTALNQDYSGLYVKVLVVANEVAQAPFVTAGS